MVNTSGKGLLIGRSFHRDGNIVTRNFYAQARSCRGPHISVTGGADYANAPTGAITLWKVSSNRTHGWNGALCVQLLKREARHKSPTGHWISCAGKPDQTFLFAKMSIYHQQSCRVAQLLLATLTAVLTQGKWLGWNWWSDAWKDSWQSSKMLFLPLRNSLRLVLSAWSACAEVGLF